MKNKWCTGWRQGRGIGGHGSEGSTRARQPRKGASCPQQGAGTENTQGEGEPLCPWRHPSHCAQRSGRMVTPRHTARGRPSHKPPWDSFPGAAVQRGRLQGAVWGATVTHRFGICLGNSFRVSQASGARSCLLFSPTQPVPGEGWALHRRVSSWLATRISPHHKTRGSQQRTRSPACTTETSGAAGRLPTQLVFLGGRPCRLGPRPA